MMKPRKAYPTDLNDTEYEAIAPVLEKKSTRGAPRQIPWREILNAIFYVLKNGCGWRALPHNFPNWKTVYHYFRQLQKEGKWELLNQKVREAVREQSGCEPQASAMILDSQSAKSAEGGQERGYDAFKKVVGRKRNLIVDTLGFLVVAKVTSAKEQDVAAGRQVCEELAKRPELIQRLKIIWADGGYRGDLEEWVQQNLHATLDIVLKPEGQKGFQVLPKRWVIERTNAWLSRQRRLARDYERLVDTSEAFIYTAMLRLGLRRLSQI